MPVDILATIAYNGISSVPYFSAILRSLPWLLVAYLIKTYARGVQSHSERILHSKVVMMTVSKHLILLIV